MNVHTLIDYLGQFDGDETVVCDDDEFEGVGNYVALRSLLLADDPEPDEWFTEDYVGHFANYGHLIDSVAQAQTPTILHDHSPGEDCGDCERWYC